MWFSDTGSHGTAPWGFWTGRWLACTPRRARPRRPRRPWMPQGCLIYPGMVDAHVHCHSNQAETIELATQAAAAGGVTTILDMPYDIGAPVNTVEIFRAKVTRDPPGRPGGRGHAGNAAEAGRGRGGGAAGARGGLRLQDERLRDRPRPLPAHRRPRPLAGPARDRPPWRARRVPRGDRPHHRGPDRPGQAGRPHGCRWPTTRPGRPPARRWPS